jgi:DNA-binding LytR/AlgR family response regulator
MPEQLIYVFLWIAFVPLVILPLARRVPVTPAGLLAHGTFGLVIAIAHTLLLALLLASYSYGWSPAAIHDIFRDRMNAGYARNIFTYLTIVAGMLLWMNSRRVPEPVTIAPQAEPAEGYLRRVLVKADGRMTLIRTEQVTWLEASDNDVLVHAPGGSHTVRGTLSRFAERLNPATFVRVHRSAIVNVDRVKEVQSWFSGDLIAILDDGTRVNVSRTHRDAFLAALEG